MLMHALKRETDVASAAWDRVMTLAQHGVGRRALLATLAGAGLQRTPLPAPDAVVAKKAKKVTLCRDGQTITVSKSKKKSLLKRGATPGRCQIQPPSCLPTAANLQAAVNAAPLGATLTLCAGRRTLTSTVQISQELTLVGAGAAQTLLDGGDAVQVLTIGELARVTLRDLTITRGRAFGPAEADVFGGGIFNNGVVTLVNATVTGNSAGAGGGITTNGSLTLGAGSVVSANDAEDGAGVFVGIAGTLTMLGGSRISGNTASGEGGGFANLGTATLEADSRVSGNTAVDDGGGISTGGVLTLKGGSLVGGDRPEDANTSPRGGGISNAQGVVTLEANSRVSGNSASENGGGILNRSGTVTLQSGSRVTNNTSTGAGGGIFRSGGTVVLDAGSEVSGNSPDNCSPVIGACA